MAEYGTPQSGFWDKDVPAKCLNEFVDHYKAQQQRVQPPEAK